MIINVYEFGKDNQWVGINFPPFFYEDFIDVFSVIWELVVAEDFWVILNVDRDGCSYDQDYYCGGEVGTA